MVNDPLAGSKSLPTLYHTLLHRCCEIYSWKVHPSHKNLVGDSVVVSHVVWDAVDGAHIVWDAVAVVARAVGYGVDSGDVVFDGNAPGHDFACYCCTNTCLNRRSQVSLNVMLTEVYQYHLNDWPNCVLTKNCEHLLSKTMCPFPPLMKHIWSMGHLGHLVNGQSPHLIDRITGFVQQTVQWNLDPIAEITMLLSYSILISALGCEPLTFW